MEYDSGMSDYRAERGRYCSLRDTGHFGVGARYDPSVGGARRGVLGEARYPSVGEDLIECFDAIDTLSKSAQIYFSARMTGYEPEGMTDQQLDDLVPAFGL